MKLSDGEKIIVSMLADLHKALKVESDLDPEFIQEALTSGQTWAIRSRYPGLLNDYGVDDATVRTVHEVLSFWSVVERSYDQLSDTDKARIEAEAQPFGKNPRFPGFDGNNESELMGTAAFMVEHLGMYPEFEGRANLNSHMPTRDSFRRMQAVYKPMVEKSFNYDLTADGLIAILRERIHPENRA